MELTNEITILVKTIDTVMVTQYAVASGVLDAAEQARHALSQHFAARSGADFARVECMRFCAACNGDGHERRLDRRIKCRACKGTGGRTVLSSERIGSDSIHAQCDCAVCASRRPDGAHGDLTAI